MDIETWRRYAQCWSQPADERRAPLAQHVTDDVCYRDPNIEVAGRDALDAYMDGFQHAFPGHRFDIRDVVTHHDRSVAWWTQRDPGGTGVQDGISFAAHDTAGRLRDITGFFGTPSAADRTP